LEDACQLAEVYYWYCRRDFAFWEQSLATKSEFNSNKLRYLSGIMEFVCGWKTNHKRPEKHGILV
jgi:hypothetical protein